MSRSSESPGARLLSTWRRLRGVPGGSWIFSRIVGRTAPYTGALGPHVRDLRPGYARITLRDRRGLRNHLRSIHAVAVANLGEVTSGLAMLAGLPPTVRGIVTSLSVEYTKKARGTLTAACDAAIPEVMAETPHVVVAVIEDATGDVVARVSVTWNLRPVAS